MSGPTDALARRTDLVMRPDPRRVVAKLFVPGQEPAAPGRSRAMGLFERCMKLDDAEVDQAMDLLENFAGRHRGYERILQSHFDSVAGAMGGADGASPKQRRLVGASFTQEYAIEAAALFNPSMVAHPEPDPDPDRLRFVMSARAVGEGHMSSIVFCTGTVSDDAGTPQVTMDPRPVLATRGEVRMLTSDSYETEFDPATELAERTLLPEAEPERQGLEDARFVRFTDDGASTYLATYTAYDGRSIAPARLQTDDFRTFRASPFTGEAATNKGLALFPRKVGGRYLALSRWDRETNGIVMSDDGHHWDESVVIERPGRSWDLVQVGNCGSPIETPQGWLVLTHGVGQMREYSIGALLLDLDEPTTVIGQLAQPLLRPEGDERDGYVPNVVYSCGGMQYAQTLLLPYGCSDSSIRLALVDLPALIEALQAGGPAGA